MSGVLELNSVLTKTRLWIRKSSVEAMIDSLLRCAWLGPVVFLGVFQHHVEWPLWENLPHSLTALT